MKKTFKTTPGSEGSALIIVVPFDVKAECGKARTAPRAVAIPRELAKNERAKAAWKQLSYGHQREHAEAIVGAKKPETRARRVRNALKLLLGAK